LEVEGYENGSGVFVGDKEGGLKVVVVGGGIGGLVLSVALLKKGV